MKKGFVRTNIRGGLKMLAAFALVATQFITLAPGITGQAQSPPNVDIPSLVGKSMAEVIQQIKKPRSCGEILPQNLGPGLPGAASDYDVCQFKIGRDRLTVATYRGRVLGFHYLFVFKESTNPAEALSRVGIDVNGAKPQIKETDPGILRDYVWSGTFNKINWKEIRVTQLLKMNGKCNIVFAILPDKAE
jgi:hypothetical protein